MGIKTFSENLDIIQQLSDRPLELDGLGAEELKALFDKASNLLKDYINTELVPAINGFVGKEHNHQNKALLDTVTPDAVHAHSNKALLDTLSEGSFHSHERLGLLESYTQTNADISDAVGKKHSHSNSALLDGLNDDSILSADERTLINNLSSPAGFAAAGVAARWNHLWHNPAPSANFGAQRMNVSGLKDCNLICIMMGISSGYYYCQTGSLFYIPGLGGVQCKLMAHYNSNSLDIVNRNMTINRGDETIDFSTGFRNSPSFNYENPSYAIPIDILGTTV